jgi:hypothetical protein
LQCDDASLQQVDSIVTIRMCGTLKIDASDTAAIRWIIRSGFVGSVAILHRVFNRSDAACSNSHIESGLRLGIVGIPEP